MQLLSQFENLELTVAEEKAKNSILRKLAVIISSGLVPEIYLEMAYNFCIGTLWLKYAFT